MRVPVRTSRAALSDLNCGQAVIFSHVILFTEHH
jgi:hypothetical protein